MNKNDIIYGVVIHSKKERNILKEYLISKNIPITYPSLFEGKLTNHLFAFNCSGVGLASTIVMRYLSERKLVYKVNQLDSIALN